MKAICLWRQKYISHDQCSIWLNHTFETKWNTKLWQLCWIRISVHATLSEQRIKGELRCKNEPFSEKREVRKGSILNSLLVFSSFVPYIFWLKRSRKSRLDFRHLGCFLSRVVLTSSCLWRHVVKVLMSSSLWRFVFVRSCTTLGFLRRLSPNNCLV